MLTCAALILNHNGRRLLAPLYDSLVAQDGLTAICLIDNASTDDSVNFTRTRYPMVQIIQNAENLSFGTAYNLAIRTRSEDVIFIVNNDVVVHRGAIRNALEFLGQHSDVASVSFEGLDPDRKGEFGSSCPPLCRFGKLLSPGRNFRGPDDRPVESPFYLWGAACCIRREVFRKIEFDEAMDWGFEDVDLAWSIARRTGMRNIFLPGATIFHLESHTSRKRFRSSQIHEMVTRNAILSFAKNATARELVRATPYILYNFLRFPGRRELARKIVRHVKLRWKKNDQLE